MLREIITNLEIPFAPKDTKEIIIIFFKQNKTGIRQCTRAVWNTSADIHSTYLGAFVHYLVLLEFPVPICDASYITTYTRPT